MALTTSFWNICVRNVFLTTILSISIVVPLDPPSSILNPSPPTSADTNVDVPKVPVSPRVKVDPSKVRLASAFIASAPVAVTT